MNILVFNISLFSCKQVSRLCVGWDVGNGKKGGANVRGIAISIGDYAPSFDDIWLSKSKFEEKEKHKLYTKGILRPNTKDARFIELQKTNQLENTIYLDQPKVFILKSLRMKQIKCNLAILDSLNLINDFLYE